MGTLGLFGVFLGFTTLLAGFIVIGYVILKF